MAKKNVSGQKSDFVRGLVFPIALLLIGAVIIILNMVLDINENNYNILGFAIIIAGIAIYVGEASYKR